MSGSVGSRVRAIREGLGISQQELERRSGVSRGYVSRLEGGKRGDSISHEQLTALARGLGVDAQELQTMHGYATATRMTPPPTSAVMSDPCPHRTQAASLALADGVPPDAIARVMALPPDPARSVLSWAREMVRVAEERGRRAAADSGEHRLARGEPSKGG